MYESTVDIKLEESVKSLTRDQIKKSSNGSNQNNNQQISTVILKRLDMSTVSIDSNLFGIDIRQTKSKESQPADAFPVRLVQQYEQSCQLMRKQQERLFLWFKEQSREVKDLRNQINMLEVYKVKNQKLEEENEQLNQENQHLKIEHSNLKQELKHLYHLYSNQKEQGHSQTQNQQNYTKQNTPLFSICEHLVFQKKTKSWVKQENTAIMEDQEKRKIYHMAQQIQKLKEENAILKKQFTILSEQYKKIEDRCRQFSEGFTHLSLQNVKKDKIIKDVFACLESEKKTKHSISDVQQQNGKGTVKSQKIMCIPVLSYDRSEEETGKNQFIARDSFDCNQT